jgi:ribosome biogenesis GTPase
MGADAMTGTVIRGSRNIFTVLSEGREFECRIKGKILKEAEGYYNSLAPGDLVEFEPDGLLILRMKRRRNLFTRFNQKGRSPQVLAANADLILCVTTPASPPFRPRFLDRALLQGDIAGIPSVLVCNKYDLCRDDPDMEERLEDYRRIGYQVLRVSALNGEGLDELAALMDGRFSVLIGQSGVGKSSLINALAPGMKLKVGPLNEKYDRGNHTTTMASLVEFSFQNRRIRAADTPGLRRLCVAGIGRDELIHYMREFAPLAGRCTYGLSCSHKTEPGCKVMEAVAAGVVHEDRYESFLRIRDELSG